MKNEQQNPTPKKSQDEKKPKIIADRKSCSADGVGLSHYILMDKKSK